MDHIQLAERYGAHNYHPLPVVLATGEGAWVTDVDGNRYLDCLAGYSALNFGHAHPKLLARAEQQLHRLTLTSRAFYNDQLGPFLERLAELTGKERSLPMNTGAEAVETALKIARRWGVEVKNVDPSQSNIIVMDGNFHGRTTTIISFSNDDAARRGFGPYTPGFRQAVYGDLSSVEELIDEHTVAVLFEPVQGESGVIVPPAHFVTGLRELCSLHNVLMIADEIQSGLGRAGATFACDRFGVTPDVYVLGKALGGGVVPVSAISCDDDIMHVITPGSHGSTFGGNPLSAAVGHEVLGMLADGSYQARAMRLGHQLEAGLATLPKDAVVSSRVFGLWAGVDVNPELMSGRDLSEALLARGVLAKETHGSTLRLAPPLVASEEDIELLVNTLRDSLS